MLLSLFLSGEEVEASPGSVWVLICIVMYYVYEGIKKASTGQIEAM